MDTQNPPEDVVNKDETQTKSSQETTPQESVIAGNKNKAPSTAIVGILVLLIALVGVLYYFASHGWPFGMSGEQSFNIPTDGNQVILLAAGTLLALNVDTEEITELGIFKDGEQIVTADAVAISQDQSHIALAFSRTGGGSNILVFSDFETYEKVASQVNFLQSLSVSNSGEVLFSETLSNELDDIKTHFTSPNSSNVTEPIDSAQTPLFLDGGQKILHSTNFGYRVIDLEAKDFLDTETPQLLSPIKVAISRDNNYFSIIDEEGWVKLYEIASTRPFSLVTESEFAVNVSGTRDMAISSDGRIAFTWNPNGVSILTTVDSSSKTIKTHEQDIIRHAFVVSWNR